MGDRVDTGAVQQEVLRHRAQCVGCRSKLPPRGLAWVHRDAAGVEQVVCDTCFRAGTFPETLRPEGYLTAKGVPLGSIMYPALEAQAAELIFMACQRSHEG